MSTNWIFFKWHAYRPRTTRLIMSVSIKTLLILPAQLSADFFSSSLLCYLMEPFSSLSLFVSPARMRGTAYTVQLGLVIIYWLSLGWRAHKHTHTQAHTQWKQVGWICSARRNVRRMCLCVLGLDDRGNERGMVRKTKQAGREGKWEIEKERLISGDCSWPRPSCLSTKVKNTFLPQSFCLSPSTPLRLSFPNVPSRFRHPRLHIFNTNLEYLHSFPGARRRPPLHLQSFSFPRPSEGGGGWNDREGGGTCCSADGEELQGGKAERRSGEVSVLTLSRCQTVGWW